MYLLDTNIWLEYLLSQTQSREAERLLRDFPSDSLYLTDFTLHSIGIILFRVGKHEVFLNFARDALAEGSAGVLHVGVEHLPRLVEAVETYRLDFDDAYQYAAAELFDLTIVSFDADFDHTKRGRKEPGELIP